ncbi:MAG: DUF1801 domain-containing protein [Atribacterota bacterium]|nr:DUF1801 domain-containing protein [Atribacterota bacterium]
MKKSKKLSMNIDEYIADYSPEVRIILQQIRNTIRKVAPDAVETIKYQMPTFVLHENLVHFAAHKKHIGFYPTPSGREKFKDEIAVYKHAKGSVQFPIDKPIPLKLIEKVVAFRVKEVEKKATTKDKKKN